MPSISFLVILALIVIFSDAHAVHPTPIEHDAFEKRVKQADTIIFGRFHWLLPIGKIDGIDSVHATQQDTFEFIVYCTMKNKKSPNNIPHVIVVTIEDYGSNHDDGSFDIFLVMFIVEARMTMRKNRWFVLFPEQTKDRNRWSINNRSDAYDLEDELELHVFEQFCFLNPKLPIGKTLFILGVTDLVLIPFGRFPDEWSAQSLSASQSRALFEKW